MTLLSKRRPNLLLKNNKLSLIGLLEHKVKEVNVKRVLNFICPHWLFAHNYSFAPIGRILVCWDPQILNVNVLDQSSQYIHWEVHSIQTGIVFLSTFVYGANDYVERQYLWSSLLNLKSTSPWVTIGDFNAIRSHREKSGGSSLWPPHMDEMNNSLYYCELDDLRFSGCFFTWSNRQIAPNHISSKIDRVLVNESWMRAFPYSSAFFPTPGISDHSPIPSLGFLTSWLTILYFSPQFKRVGEPLSLATPCFVFVKNLVLSKWNSKNLTLRSLVQSLIGLKVPNFILIIFK